MTHDISHSIYLLAGAIYFTGALYFAFKNYQHTNHDGYWFFMILFTMSMIGVMVSGTLWSFEKVSEPTIHPYYDILFLIASIFIFVGAYTLNKEHHEVSVF
jgi:hypothetical protein